MMVGGWSDGWVGGVMYGWSILLKYMIALIITKQHFLSRNRQIHLPWRLGFCILPVTPSPIHPWIKQKTITPSIHPSKWTFVVYIDVIKIIQNGNNGMLFYRHFLHKNSTWEYAEKNSYMKMLGSIKMNKETVQNLFYIVICWRSFFFKMVWKISQLSLFSQLHWSVSLEIMKLVEAV